MAESPPEKIVKIGEEIAILWPDKTESYFPPEFLRRHSPSASNQGEVDILGQRHGGDGPKFFAGVRVISWERVGNYAVAFHFSDGHATGIYSWSYLRQLHRERQQEEDSGTADPSGPED